MSFIALAQLATSVAAAPVSAPALGVPSSPIVLTSSSARLSDDDLLLLDVELDQLTLTDSLSAHGDPADPLLPVGELTRLLDLNVDVLPAQRRIVGTFGEAQTPLLVDLSARIARRGSTDVMLSPEDAIVGSDEIYVRASKLEMLLPLKIKVDSENLSVKLTATQQLPIQAKWERIGRSRGTSADPYHEPSTVVAAPYKIFTPPSFDVALEVGRDTATLRDFSRRYDVRAAGDLLYANLQAYVGSDESGHPSTARFLLERRSDAGKLPFGATRVSAGDVFTPALALGPRSVGGRGFSFSNAPIQQVSVFDTIDLRGELPIGYDVELYINDVLRSGQRTPVDGRYEFLNIPLVRGLNVIRIVTYGPRGDRSDSVRVINVGGGQLKPGETQVEFGAVDKGRSLFEFGRTAKDPLPSQGNGGLRVVGSVAHGLTEQLTLVAGAATYGSPSSRGQRTIATTGIRTSLLGFAVQADVAADKSGAMAFAAGAAGQPLGASLVLQHVEYRGGFADELVTSDSSQDPVRHTNLTLDFSSPPVGGKRVPLSFHAVRDEFADHSFDLIATARASATIFDALVSTGFNFEQTRGPTSKTTRVVGNVSASRFVNLKWQLRASTDYQLLPTRYLQAVSFTADRNLDESTALRFGFGKSFGPENNTFLQAGGVLRFPFGELAVTGDYAVERKDWRLALRCAFGSLFDPNRGRYVLTRPGPASGANAAIRAYLDRDGDGRFSSQDQPLPDVKVETGARSAKTNSAGFVTVTGLGSTGPASVRMNSEDIDQLAVATSVSRIEFPSRPGEVVQIDYPVRPVGQIYARIMTSGASGVVGISAVRVRLEGPNRASIEGTTEYDGSVVFADVPLGKYTLKLDDAQASRLGMRLDHEPEITVTSDHDADIEVRVAFTSKTDGSADQINGKIDAH